MHVLSLGTGSAHLLSLRTDSAHLLYFQLERLEDVFKEQRYPDVYRREEIATELELKEEVVRVRQRLTLLRCSAEVGPALHGSGCCTTRV